MMESVMVFAKDKDGKLTKAIVQNCETYEEAITAMKTAIGSVRALCVVAPLNRVTHLSAAA